MIRSDARNQIQQYADAVGSLRWSNAHIDLVMGERQLYWWRRLLDVNPEYTFQTSTPTTDANGMIPLAYSSGSGDSAVNSYRILGVLRDMIPLAESKYSDFKTAAIFGADLRMYYPIGTNIQILPNRSGSPITVTWNSLPVAANLLTGDSSVVAFPAGFDTLYLMDTASELLAKAGSEKEATMFYKSLVDDKREAMFATYGRMGTNGPTWRYSDDGPSWGSV